MARQRKSSGAGLLGSELTFLLLGIPFATISSADKPEVFALTVARHLLIVGIELMVLIFNGI